MNTNELHWLAGVLEGEGCFLKPSPSKPNNPVIVVSMTDEDVVARIAKLFDTTYYKSVAKRMHWKPTFITRLTGVRAVSMMQRLYPLMGQRRQQRIAEIVSEFIPRHNRLSGRQINVIRRSTKSTRQLAAEFGVSHVLIHKIKTHQLYR